MSHHTQKRQLLQRMRDLGLRIDAIESALQAPHSKDWEDMAIEREGEEVLESLGSSGQAEIARIVSALKRMADGEYGICLTCGSEIATERLNVVPDTALCRDCAAAASH